jgi:cellulose biosynthesis protein BcsQ
MRNVLVNFSKKAINNLSSVMGAGAELDTYDSITELNNSLNHGSNYDKALLWHTYPTDDDPQVMAEYAEELEQLAQLLGRSAEAPEVWVMEKTREACAFDYERLSNVSDLVIVHIASMGGIGPVLQSALGSTISAIKVSKSLVGLYGEAEYNEDIEQVLSKFDEADEFESVSEDEFESADDAAGFEDASASDFDDADSDDFADDPNFDDEFETEDDRFADASADDFVDDEDDGAVAPPPKSPAVEPVAPAAPVTPAPDEIDEFEDEFEGSFDEGDDSADSFEDADDVEPQAPYGDSEDDFAPQMPTSFDTDTEDEFEEAPAMGDFDDFEEAPAAEEFADAEEDTADNLPTGDEDEFDDDKAAAPAAAPIPTPVAEPEPPKKKGFFGKKQKAAPAAAPVVAPVATPAATAAALDEAQLAAVENAELSKSALNVLKSVCAKRCCQITVTGEHCSGKSTVAMNLGNVLSKHFKVLVVDMDGETRGISYMHNDIIQNIPVDDSGMRSIFSAGLNSGNKPFVVKKNLAVSTMGLASDTFKTNEVFIVNNVTRAHNQLMHSFDFIIYDMPLDAALDKLTGFITTSYILYCVEANNYGFTNLLFRIANVDDNAVAQQLVENAIIVPTKSSGYSFVGNIPVKNTKQALRAVQSIANELVGGECELDFASMEFAATLPFNPQVQQMVGSKHFYSDSAKGFKEYSKLIASVFGL